MDLTIDGISPSSSSSSHQQHKDTRTPEDQHDEQPAPKKQRRRAVATDAKKHVCPEPGCEKGEQPTHPFPPSPGALLAPSTSLRPLLDSHHFLRPPRRNRGDAVAALDRDIREYRMARLPKAERPSTTNYTPREPRLSCPPTRRF